MYTSVWSLRSDRLPLQAPGQRKNVCSSTKMSSALGGERGLCPLDPRLGLCLQTPVIGSLAIAAHPSAPPGSNYFRRPCTCRRPTIRQDMRCYFVARSKTDKIQLNPEMTMGQRVTGQLTDWSRGSRVSTRDPSLTHDQVNKTPRTGYFVAVMMFDFLESTST